MLVIGKPQIEFPKLLGIPTIEDSTGASQHRAVVHLLNNWGILKNVIGLCFDTTASNTGRFKGSATTIESTIGKSVLWLACRHHVYELHVKHVSDSIIGKRNTPSEALFVRFQKEWPNIDQDHTVSDSSIRKTNYLFLLMIPFLYRICPCLTLKWMLVCKISLIP